jgi:CRISPR-associated endonuclease/helicase Cas3
MISAGKYFWAKTTPEGKPGISVQSHCLNVGLVAEAIIAALPATVRSLLPPGLATLAGLHDVGKICPGFQAKCDQWIHQNGLVQAAVVERWKLGCETDHAKVSQWTLQQLFNGDEDLFDWAMAVGAHHGRIKGQRLTKLNLSGSIGDAKWDGWRQSLARELIARFGDLPAKAPAGAMLWWVAGLITVADWIGSDETWFPPDGSLADNQRSERAVAALNDIQWHSAALESGLAFAELFPGYHATALQRAVFEQVTRPGTYLIEGAMGCGKTEAALAAAYHLIADGQAGGLYFALPTQTTSNKIHERVERFLRRIETRPHDLRLAHGSAWLREDFHLPVFAASFTSTSSPKSRVNESGEDEVLITRDHVRAGRSWFASGKRALLSSFGVGTVDQALLGIVAAKHFFVRQFGLAGKVVILDEIHTYDLYTGTLLDQLLRRLRELRCTVLILSATLTRRRREELLQAADAQVVSDGNAYPLLTLAPEGENTRSLPFAADESKEIHIATTADSDLAIAARCLDRAEAGQCVLWIRNTVDDAQSTYRQLKNNNRQGGPPVGLLHARFPLWRRQELEDFWLEALGKDSNNRPKGCVLVATQVVEQSVDIDADFLVTDLAPSDMLLQRIGRLWRHQRPNRAGRPEVLIHTGGLTSENGRAGSADDLKSLLGRSAFVYAPYVLLRTFEIWRQRSQIKLPADIRPLLESTYAEPTEDELPGWIALRRDLANRCDKLRNAAVSATLVLRQPALADEEDVQTRWNDRPTVQLLLATAPPSGLPAHNIQLPLADGSESLIPDYRFDLNAARALHRNLVRIPAWAGRPATTASPEWLTRLVPQRVVLGVVRANDGAILFGESPSGMAWHIDEGVTLPRRSKNNSQPPTSIPNYDDDESFD